MNYWNRLHESMDILEENVSHVLGLPSQRFHFSPGNLAVSRRAAKISYVFYEYLQNIGLKLSPVERKAQDAMLRQKDTFYRPCVVLAPHSQDSCIVCYLVSARYSDIDRLSPLIRHLAVPFPSDAAGVQPELSSRFLLALPVVRRFADLKPFLKFKEPYTPVRYQLSYGALEQLGSIVRAYEKYAKKNHKTIRREIIAWKRPWIYDADAPSIWPKVLPKQPEARHWGEFLWQRRFRLKKFYTSRALPPPPCNFPPMDNRISWILNGREAILFNASSYLSSTLQPVPPFRLPVPEFSSLRRAGAHLARRIIP